MLGSGRRGLFVLVVALLVWPLVSCETTCTEETFAELSYNEWNGDLTRGVGLALPDGKGLFYVDSGGNVKFTFLLNSSVCPLSQQGRVTTVVAVETLQALGMTGHVSAMALRHTSLYLLGVPYVFVIPDISVAPQAQPVVLAGPFSLHLVDLAVKNEEVALGEPYLYIADRGGGCVIAISTGTNGQATVHPLGCPGSPQLLNSTAVHSVFTSKEGLYVGAGYLLYVLKQTAPPTADLVADLSSLSPELTQYEILSLSKSPSALVFIRTAKLSDRKKCALFVLDLTTKTIALFPGTGMSGDKETACAVRDVTFVSNGTVLQLLGTGRAAAGGKNISNPIEAYRCGNWSGLLGSLPPDAFCTPEVNVSASPSNTSTTTTWVPNGAPMASTGAPTVPATPQPTFTTATGAPGMTTGDPSFPPSSTAVYGSSGSEGSDNGFGRASPTHPSPDTSVVIAVAVVLVVLIAVLVILAVVAIRQQRRRRKEKKRLDEEGDLNATVEHRVRSTRAPTTSKNEGVFDSLEDVQMQPQQNADGDNGVTRQEIGDTYSGGEPMQRKKLIRRSAPAAALSAPDNSACTLAETSPTSTFQSTSEYDECKRVGTEPAGLTSARSTFNSTMGCEEKVDTTRQRKVETKQDRQGSAAATLVSNSSSIVPGTLLSEGSLPIEEETFAWERQLIRNGEYHKVKLLGRGAYGSVFSCLLTNGKTVAMKVMELSPEDFETVASDVEREIDVIRQLQHENVVQYISARAIPETHSITLFMELVTGGSLGCMARSVKEPLPEVVVRRLIRQATVGLAFIHSKGIIHRDIKGDNMLLTTDGVVKLADFGTAKSLAPGATRGAQTMIGTPYYMAPELLNGGDDGQVGYGMKADVWSLGITVGELLNKGTPPWPTFTNPGQAFLYIAGEGQVPTLPEHTSDLAKDFVLTCCRRDAKERPSCAQLLEHSWLQGLSSSVEEEGFRSSRRDSSPVRSSSP